MACLDRCVDLPVAADIAGNGDSRWPDFPRNIGDRFAVACDKRHISPRRGKDPRRRSADALACPGDQSGFSLHIHGVPHVDLPFT